MTEKKGEEEEKKGSMLRARESEKQCWFSWVAMDAHLVSVVSLPAVVTLQQKGTNIWIIDTREDIKKVKYVEKFARNSL